MAKEIEGLIKSEEDVTAIVLSSYEKTSDPRLNEIMTSLTKHLHAFLLETRPTEEEYEMGLRWVASLGHHTDNANNEVVLAADVLGASTLIDLMNNNGGRGETMSALLGPFYRGGAPDCGVDDNIARSDQEGLPLFFSGRVIDLDGSSIAGASVDVWQASPVGLYENQDAGQDDFNLRGKFTSDAEGRYSFRSVRPSGYPVPTSGPVGDLLRAQNRKAFRPAHVHFIVSAPGRKTLITQVFSDTDEAMIGDVVFGAKEAIVGDFVSHQGPHPDYPGVEGEFFTCKFDFKLVEGTPTFPVPPISGKVED
ncbi:MAG: catechol 1,2-dioxygenase [Hyphomicrobiales bacterium]|nr:MAG: catechol 1,2-dioxygenase [Hyphomicrobiales bacterium]